MIDTRDDCYVGSSRQTVDTRRVVRGSQVQKTNPTEHLGIDVRIVARHRSQQCHIERAAPGPKVVPITKSDGDVVEPTPAHQGKRARTSQILADFGKRLTRVRGDGVALRLAVNANLVARQE